MKLNKLVAIASLAGSLIATNAFAYIVTLNPSASNVGAVNGSQLSTDAAFNTEKATTDFASRIVISGAANAAGPQSFVETGFLRVAEFSGNPNTTTGVTLNYNIYATFTITGFGTWAAPNTFVGAVITDTTADIFGSPGATPLALTTPTAGNPFGVTPDAADFLLGSGTLVQGLNALASIFADGSAFASFGAILRFEPAANTSGITGFWQAPTPFAIGLDTSGVSLNSFTTWTDTTGSTVITTRTTTNGNVIVGGGAGNVAFLPEPGSVALLGLVTLVGAGVSRARSRKSV